MSESIEQPSAEQVQAFGDKLVTFKQSLGPREQQLFTEMMSAAQESLVPDVAGFDGEGPASDLVTKINWDALTTLSIAPSPNLYEGGRLDHNDSR